MEKKTRNKILWEGRPKYKPRLAFLEIFGGGAEVGPITQVMPILFIVNIFYIIKSYFDANYFLFSILIALILLTILGPEIHKRIRRAKTKYIATQSKITIVDYWYGKNIVNEIEFRDVIKFYLENYEGDCGIIHIYPTEKLFSTRNFWSGSIRQTITLEDVDNASEVFKMLNGILLEVIQK